MAERDYEWAIARRYTSLEWPRLAVASNGNRSSPITRQARICILDMHTGRWGGSLEASG